MEYAQWVRGLGELRRLAAYVDIDGRRSSMGFDSGLVVLGGAVADYMTYWRLVCIETCVGCWNERER